MLLYHRSFRLFILLAVCLSRSLALSFSLRLVFLCLCLSLSLSLVFLCLCLSRSLARSFSLQPALFCDSLARSRLSACLVFCLARSLSGAFLFPVETRLMDYWYLLNRLNGVVKRARRENFYASERGGFEKYFPTVLLQFLSLAVARIFVIYSVCSLVFGVLVVLSPFSLSSFCGSLCFSLTSLYSFPRLESDKTHNAFFGGGIGGSLRCFSVAAS